MLQYSYPTEEAAIAALEADGFRESGQFWSKRSKVDDWYGGYPKMALATVQHRRVDPKWSAPDYFEIKFH